MNDDKISHSDIIKRLDTLETKLEPIISTWEDVAGIVRGWSLVARFILWTAGVVVLIMAAWNAVVEVI